MERHFPRQFVPVVGALLSLLLTPVGRAQDASAPATFSNYELAGNPFVNQFSVGTTCPNSSGTCVNTQGEPAIRADPAGNFYGSSENVFCVIGGLCGGTFAWKSTDAGAHFTSLPLPNSVSAGQAGISPAGGDTDIAVAPRENANGFYNIYVASLQSKPPLAEIYVSTTSGVIHYGGVCESGVTCTGNRDLLDDFGVAASPTTGLAAIIYTSDQYLGTAAEPARTQGSTTCMPTNSNTSECSHTDIAVQTGGTGVGPQHDHHFVVNQGDFEQTNVGNSGNPSPQFKMQIANTADVAISSLAIQVAGMPVALTWSSGLPLLPGETVSGTAGSLPSGLALAVGNVYPVSITATLPDGTTETQTTSVIYTLGAGLGL